MNISRLLQTLDSDDDLSNGILLAPWATNINSPETIDFESLDFTAQLNDLLSTYSSSSRSLVGGSDAIAHLANSLVSNGIQVSMVDESQSAPLIGEINGIEVLTDDVTGTQKIAVSTSSAMYIAR